MRGLRPEPTLYPNPMPFTVLSPEHRFRPPLEPKCVRTQFEIFLVFTAICLLASVRSQAQTVLFDFDTAPVHSPLPITLTVAGITAEFSASGQGFSIQRADVMGFTPAGFAGNCVYPSSVFASDLRVTFSAPIEDFSILYAPQELACDSSATMKVTAYSDGALVGLARTNAAAGTWPTETLRFSSSQPFNSVVVHYDAPPVTGGDWGPIFMADNMQITPGLLPIVLANPMTLPSGAFQFSFTNTPGHAFTVLATSNLTLNPKNWEILGSPIEISPGQYQFADPQSMSSQARFYCVRFP